MINKMIEQVITGTGATINVELGFTPDYVEVVNCTSMDKISYRKNDTVNAYGVAEPTTAAGADVTHIIVRSKAADAAHGLTPYAGSPGSAAKGVTIGASAAVNVNTQKLILVAGVYEN